MKKSTPSVDFLRYTILVSTHFSAQRLLEILALLLVLMFFVWVYGNRSTDRYDPIVQDATVEQYQVVAFGDSIIEGLGAKPDQDFVSILEDRLNIPILNLGHRGDTTLTATLRLTEVLSHNPEIIILSLGGNDVLQGVDVEQRFRNLDYIISQIKKSDAEIILMGVRTGVWQDPYQQDFIQYAASRNIIFIPNVLEGILFNPLRLSDPVHPNNKGHEIIADRVEPILRALLNDTK